MSAKASSEKIRLSDVRRATLTITVFGRVIELRLGRDARRPR